LKIGSNTIYNTQGRGLTLTIITKATHAVVSTVNYDTYGDSSASDSLAIALNGINNTQIGILTSYDAWESNVNSNLETAFLRLGLSKAMLTENSGARRSYAAIFEGASASEKSAKAVEVSMENTANQPYAVITGYLIEDSFVATGSEPNALFSPQGDIIALGVDYAGNVGIGTTSPSYKLDVSGTGRFTSTVEVGTPTSGSHAATKAYVDSAITDIGIGGYVPTSRTISTTNGITGGGDLTANRTLSLDSTVVRTTGNQTIGGTKTFSSAVVLSTAGTATNHAVRADRTISTTNGITGGGNLTANRTLSLDSTVIRTTGNQTLAGTKTFSSPVVVATPTGSTHAATKAYVDSMFSGSGPWTLSGSDVYVTNTAYNVGIGTSSPAAKLNISESAGTVHGAAQGSFIIDHENSGGASSIVFRSKKNRGSDYGYIQYQDDATIGGTGESARLIIGTSNDSNDHIILQPAGSVGIGQTSPGYKLDVSGTGRFTSTVEVGAPTGPTHAATKQYVDSAITDFSIVINLLSICLIVPLI
jgi:hypothetical protein